MGAEENTVQNNKHKHAYLIMAHHRPDLLKELLLAIDDARNDVYLHIDKKSLRKMPPEQFTGVMQKSRLTVIPSKKVNWGGYSQIDCELRLLEAAVTHKGDYAYYHLLTGSTYPLKSQDEIHQFFEEQSGEQFLEYNDPHGQYDRVKYIHLFPQANKEDIAKSKSPKRGIKKFIEVGGIDLQKRLGADRFSGMRKSGYEFKKGFAYWSITHELASYILSHCHLIKKYFRYSSCGDEVFLHTLAWHEKRFRPKQEGTREVQGNCLRISTWGLEAAGKERPGSNFTLDDLPMLLASDALFALKFEGTDGLGLIRKIKNQNRLTCRKFHI